MSIQIDFDYYDYYTSDATPIYSTTYASSVSLPSEYEDPIITLSANENTNTPSSASTSLLYTIILKHAITTTTPMAVTTTSTLSEDQLNEITKLSQTVVQTISDSSFQNISTVPTTPKANHETGSKFEQFPTLSTSTKLSQPKTHISGTAGPTATGTFSTGWTGQTSQPPSTLSLPTTVSPPSTGSRGQAVSTTIGNLQTPVIHFVTNSSKPTDVDHQFLSRAQTVLFCISSLIFTLLVLILIFFIYYKRRGNSSNQREERIFSLENMNILERYTEESYL